MQVVALWISGKPDKEFNMPMTGSQEVLFWYEFNLEKVLQNSGESCLSMK